MGSLVPSWGSWFLMRPLLNGGTLAGLVAVDMRDENSDPVLREAMWQHIRSEQFADAESIVRQRIAIAADDDHQLRYHLFGVLGSVLNSLLRHEEATVVLRESLAQAFKIGQDAGEIGAARYFLANQALLFGDPNEALAETRPVPDGQGHVQCLLHSVAAQALWKLDRPSEARHAAEVSMKAAPTPERRAQLAEQLSHILNAG